MDNTKYFSCSIQDTSLQEKWVQERETGMEISLEKRLTIILWVHMIRIAVQIKVISLLYLYEAYILPFHLQNWCNSILRVLNILMHGSIFVYVDILTWNMNLLFILITNKSWKMQKKKYWVYTLHVPAYSLKSVYYIL